MYHSELLAIVRQADKDSHRFLTEADNSFYCTVVWLQNHSLLAYDRVSSAAGSHVQYYNSKNWNSCITHILWTFELHKIVIKIVINMHIYKMCQTTCQKHAAATKMDSEFDSSLDYAMNSFGSSFQLKSGCDCCVAYWIRKPGMGRVQSFSTSVGSKHWVTWSETCTKNGVQSVRVYSACRKCASISEWQCMSPMSAGLQNRTAWKLTDN